MTSTDYLHFAESFFKDCVELSRKKTADYTGNGTDAFANFRQIPENWTEIGFLTRMGDKMARLRSFVQNGDLQVKDESATDTLRDLANYCALFAAYLGEQKKDWDLVCGYKVFLVQITFPAIGTWYFNKVGERYKTIKKEYGYEVSEGPFMCNLISEEHCSVVFPHPATNPDNPPTVSQDDTVMVVRVVSASIFDWYLSRIDQIFEVVSHNNHAYRVVVGLNTGQLIEKNDCKVISKH